MSSAPSRVVELVEYEPVRLSETELTEEDAQFLWEMYPTQVAIESPSFKNSRHWELRSLGCVGYIPVSERLGLLLQPKVPLQSLFGMFEYAYQINMKFLGGLFDSATLAEFYDQLALVLARRVLDRSRKGLYRCYVPRTEALAYVRGSLDIRDRIRRPWSAALQCDYEEHTADIEENQILTWTLYSIVRSGLCSERALPTVRRAYHTLDGAATTAPRPASACVNRTYNRLSEDYRPLHALCRFFLDHVGASHERGDRRMLPFIVDMNRLFERFVAEWLRVHLPSSIDLRLQETVRIGSRDDLEFRIDMLLCEQATGRPLLVLDAKYKAPDAPSMADIAQVIAYAEAIGCQRAALVYPKPLSRPVRERVGSIGVESLVFDVSGSLEEGGAQLITAIEARAETERAQL